VHYLYKYVRKRKYHTNFRVIQIVENIKYATLVLFAGGEKLFCRRSARECDRDKKVIFQRVAEFISATRFLRSRRSGDIFLPVIIEKTQRSGFFDSLSPGSTARGFLLYLKSMGLIKFKNYYGYINKRR
jgi:hypothetical protein